MDQVAHKVLWFNNFALDLTRGCLRAGDQDIDLRPKTFEVLRYLAENAGRLVLKQELYDAVWPNVVVTDDSLVQCIRELREKLCDNEHRLIKTLSRRGYLLDVTVAASAPQSSGDRLAVTPPDGSRNIATNLDVAQRLLHAVQTQKLRLWGAVAAALLCIALGTIYLLGRSPVPVANPGPVSLAENTPALTPRPIFKDCDVCPEMIALPAGEFMMGSPEDERGREQVEGLPRRVTIARPFAIGKFEITVDQFAAFVAETGTTVGNQCRVVVGLDRDPPPWAVSPEASFRRPGFEVTGLHPAGCIGWLDAQSYVAWLRRRTGKPYRLPTEAEWEYAARARTATKYSFGNDETQLCDYAKFADLATDFAWRGGCRSDAAPFGSIQVGRLKPNAWGIFDMHGNVWEWVEDCWTPNPLEIPTDGSAFARPGNCELGVLRGGSWVSGNRRLRLAFRMSINTAFQFQNHGFRVALSLGE